MVPGALAPVLGLVLLMFGSHGMTPAFAQAADDILTKASLTQKMNAQIPLDVTFRDESAKEVRLGEYFGKKPVMINLIQYRCTMLCSEEMKALAESLRELKFNVGDQFDLITVSIDARERPDLAAEYKESYVRQYGRPGAAAGWHFLTGDENAIRRLADSIGYKFTYDAKTDQFIHPDGVIVLTPEGRVARYFFHLIYPPRDLRFALMEAAANRIGSPLDAIALLCFHYDPSTGKYGLAFMKVLRLAGLATLLILGSTVLLMSRRSRAGRGSGHQPDMDPSTRHGQAG
jgi:protein SCO1